MNKILYVLAAGAAFFALSGCGSKAGEEVANVNGESVGLEDLHKYLQTKPSFLIQVPNGGIVSAQLSSTPAFQALQDLISRRILTQLAKDEGVSPTPADVDRELEFRKKVDAQYVAKQMAMGIVLQQIKDQIAIDLAQERILSKGIKVDEAEARKFIAENPSQFTYPEELEVYYIQANSDDTRKKVDSDLQLGKPFQTVAMQYSESPTVREDNARLGGGSPTYTDRLQPELKKQLAKLPEAKHTGWIKVQNGWMMFYLDKRKPARKMTVDQVLIERVQRMLRMQKGRLAVDLDRRVRKKIIESKLTIKDKTLKNLWERYIAALKRQEEQASGGASG